MAYCRDDESENGKCAQQLLLLGSCHVAVGDFGAVLGATREASVQEWVAGLRQMMSWEHVAFSDN